MELKPSQTIQTKTKEEIYDVGRGLEDEKEVGENEDKEGVERLGGMGTAKN